MKNTVCLFFLAVLFLSVHSAAQGVKPGPPKYEPADYGYEVNWAPVAVLANWYNLDFIKYYKNSDESKSGDKIGYGLSLLSYLRNSNNFSDTFPSWKGVGIGFNYLMDNRNSYYGVHLIFDNHERYRDTGVALVQKREGLRANIVFGGKEYLRNNIVTKFGWGVEVQSYKVQEFNELNKTTINSYYTTILNPFFEFKLAYLF